MNNNEDDDSLNLVGMVLEHKIPRFKASSGSLVFVFLINSK